MDKQAIFEVTLLTVSSLTTVLLARQGLSVQGNYRHIGHVNENVSTLHSCLDQCKEEIRQIQRTLDELKESIAPKN